MHARAHEPTRTSLALLLVASLTTVAAPARADVSKDQCIDANGKAQDLRRENKLAAARAQLRTCADPSCPSLVRDDCAKRLDELEISQPTIVFEVQDASGTDVIDVKVGIDGAPFAAKLDGTALRVDPGQHVFTFEVAGQPVVTEKLVIIEGAKGRRELVTLNRGRAEVPHGASSPHPEPAATSGHGIGAQKILGLAVAGVGVAGLAVGSVFGVMAFSQKSQEQSDCSSPTCSPTARNQALNDRSTGVTDATISTVAFIGGGAFLAIGAALFFSAHPSSEPQAKAVLLTPTFGPEGSGVSLSGRF